VVSFEQHDPDCGLKPADGLADGWLLENIGIEYRDDPEALEIWKRGGADVQGTRVKADAQMFRALRA